MDILSNVMQNPNGKLILVAAGTAAVSLAAFGLFRLSSTSSKSKDGVELLPALSEEEVLIIMNKILEQLKSIAQQMLRAAEGIKQQIAQAGGKMEDRKMMELYILPHLESMFKTAQDKTYYESDVEEYEVEDAVNYYVKDGHVKLTEIVERIRMIYKEFGGDVDDDEYADIINDEEEEVDVDETNGVTAGTAGVKAPKKSGAGTISHDQVVEILHTIGQEMTQRTSEFVGMYIQQHGIPSTRAEMESFQMNILALSENVESSVTEEFSVSLTSFQKALQNNANSPQIQQLIMELQETNMTIMQHHGIDFSKSMQ